MMELPRLQRPSAWIVNPFFSIITMLACLLSGCDLPGRPKPEDRPLPADQIVDFDSLFQRNCTGCHGPDGKLGPAPPLDDPLFLSIVPDDELLRVISAGRRGTPMAGFSQEHGGPLTAQQVKALALGLKAHFTSRANVKGSLPPYRTQQVDGPSTEDLAEGEKIFGRACAGCHGAHGEGTDGAGALAEPAFLGLLSDQALRRLIITGRPDLGMPNFTEDMGRDTDYEPLSSDEIDALVAFIGTWRKGPAPNADSDKSSTADKGKVP
jgi:cytochrome c oxidase cbb3-type subunit 3